MTDKPINGLRGFFNSGSGGILLRLFLGLWITVIATIFIVWLLITVYHQVSTDDSLTTRPSTTRSVNAAVGVLRWGGQDALVNWLLDPNANRRPKIFVVNEKGEEISGRPVPPVHADKMGRDGRQGRERIITDVRDEDGHMLRFIAVHMAPPKLNAVTMTLLGAPTWVIILLLLLATGSVAAALSWHYAQPLRKLTWAMNQAAEGDLNVRVSHEIGNGYDEIGSLAKHFDSMAERIDGLITRQKRLFNDVSHELRSPLARMEVAIALAQKSPERSAEILGRIETEVSTLDALVEELLTYARLDVNAPMVKEVCDLVPVIETIAENVEFEGTDRNVRVETQIPATLMLTANQDMLGRAFENITRNALRFSPDNGCIRISASEEKDRIVIRIRDEGPGLDAKSLETIFLPFVRGSDQATGSGFGLGLAIASRAVQRHDGTLKAANTEEGGLEMTITLPVAKTDAASVPASAE